MATCGFCKARKGKSRCPALEQICSSCCGEHRLKSIDCPSDCGYLGGLAIVRDGVPASTVVSREAFASAVGKLMEFWPRGSAQEVGREALLACMDEHGEPPAAWEQHLVLGFMTYGHRGADGRRLIDHFLETRAKTLTPAEAAALLALQRAVGSLYEVQDIELGVGLGLFDLLSGETVQVREVSATYQVGKWDVLFAWIVDLGDRKELTGPALHVPRIHLAAVEKGVRKAVGEARTMHPGVPEAQLGGSAAGAALRALREALRHAPAPALHNTDGDELLFCRARYEVTDAEAVRTRLAALPWLEASHEDFRWVETGGRGSASGLVLKGRIRLEGGGLALETNSRERLERGRDLLEGSLGGLVSHRADSVQDVSQAVDSRSGSEEDDPGENELPQGIERQVVGEFLVQHYAKWIDDSLPALDGKSPRQAARTPAGRRKVETLLREIENGVGRQIGLEAVDFAGLRREIGLSKDDGSNEEDPPYDASQAPEAGWAGRSEHERIRAVETYHEGLVTHPGTPDSLLHATMHVVTENQIAAGRPPAVRASVDRLVAAGASRHEAIHAVGSVIAEEMNEIRKRRRTFDEEGVTRRLERLRARDWIGTVRG